MYTFICLISENHFIRINRTYLLKYNYKFIITFIYISKSKFVIIKIYFAVKGNVIANFSSNLILPFYFYLLE